jgi:small-conductance mechanosensitive channel
MDLQQMINDAGDWLVLTGLQLGVIIVLALVLIWIARRIARNIFGKVGQAAGSVETQKRAQTLGSVVSHAINVVIMIVATLMILEKLGIDIGPVLAAAGVLGLAVGFGAQDLVRDVISGFFILLEDQIRVGDVVRLGDKGGAVEKVNLRMVILRDLSGNVHYIRNGHIDTVTNMTKEFSRYVFDVGVAYREDVDEVIAVMKEVDEEMRHDPLYAQNILEPLEILGLNEFGDSAVVVRARNKTAPGSQWSIGREYNRRLKKAFDARDIEIPFPHVTLYMGKDKQGEAPPLRLLQERGKRAASSRPRRRK